MSLPLFQVLVGYSTCSHKDDSLFLRSPHPVISTLENCSYNDSHNHISKVNPINNKNKIIRQIAKSVLCCVLLTIASSNAQAIILYSGDNSANLTAPDTARTDVFNSVAKIINADGTGIVGSAGIMDDGQQQHIVDGCGVLPIQRRPR